MPWLINAAQLDKFRKNQKSVTILDVSWYLPASNRDARQEFLASHVSGARFLDLNELHDHESAISNMLTRNEVKIAEIVGALGISNEHKIIFYDKSDLHSSCRALWMFKVFGHNPNQLYILDGGFPAWEKYGGKIEAGEARPVTAKPYAVNYEAHFVRTLMQMKNNLHHPSEQVVDVRHPIRYAGGSETRLGMRTGHIPGSFCFPYFTMFEADGRFKPLDKIRRQFTGIGVNLDSPIICSCGSGVTAAILDFVLDLLGHTNHSLYDGSWSEWGAEQLYPGENSLSERPIVSSLDK